MKHSFRSLLSTFVLASGAAAFGSVLNWQDITYTTHDKVPLKIPAQSARLAVPEDPANPGGPQVELMVYRLPSTSPKSGAPVIYLHGGPGGASAEHLEQPAFRALFQELRAHGDVVLFDQRGCGKSTPSLVPGVDAPAFPSDALASREKMLAYFSALSVVVRNRLVASGHDPHRYTIVESVADIEALRQALGAEKMVLLGHSYGTQLAQEYARRHPASVERMILVGSRGMDTSRKLPVETDEFLARIATMVRADPTVGAKFPDFLATLRSVLAKLDEAPLAVTMEDAQKRPFTLTVGGDALRFIIAKFYLKDPESFKFLPKLVDELNTGRRPWSLVFNLSQLLRSPISLAWFTTDAASGLSPARDRVIAAQAPIALLGGMMNFPFPEINRVWNMPDLGDDFRTPIRTDVPTLFVGGTLDGITPVAQTREIMTGFSHACLLVVENGGHDSQLSAPGVASAIAGFVAGRAPPETAQLPVPAFMPLIAQPTK
ncbi:MAG: alpha/beta hydrolase [Verrucomicrobia bacterium]|nr:alpha/beta hydrolase [Verrucomicrobiota bacterium]